MLWGTTVTRGCSLRLAHHSIWGTGRRARSVLGLTTACAPACHPQALEKYNIEKDIASYIKKEVRQRLGLRH